MRKQGQSGQVGTGQIQQKQRPTWRQVKDELSSSKTLRAVRGREESETEREREREREREFSWNNRTALATGAD